MTSTPKVIANLRDFAESERGSHNRIGETSLTPLSEEDLSPEQRSVLIVLSEAYPSEVRKRHICSALSLTPQKLEAIVKKLDGFFLLFESKFSLGLFDSREALSYFKERHISINNKEFS